MRPAALSLTAHGETGRRPSLSTRPSDLRNRELGMSTRVKVHHCHCRACGRSYAVFRLAGDEVIRAQVAGLPGIGALREVEDSGETGPVGIGVTPKDQLRLDWNGLTEDEGVEILAAARAASEGFSLTIRIPNPTDTADWWGLQAALSQAGIRRVRILSGSPANASRDGP